MARSRVRRGLIHHQTGSTLIELLVAMPIAVILLGLVVQSLGQAGVDQQDVERRSQVIVSAQAGLERMTRELRQARWVVFRSSAVVDVDVSVRTSPTTSAVPRLVRYDCSGPVCVRYQGAATSFPPPAAPSFTTSEVLVGSPTADTFSRDGTIVRHDVFRPSRVDPATGATVTEYADPDYIGITLRLQVKGRTEPIVFRDGVALRNHVAAGS